MEKFQLTEEHLDLLQSAHIRWCDVEFGAPEIDCKRPYGNSGSAVYQDIAEAIGRGVGDPPYDVKTKEELERLHHELETALQIVLSLQTFETGTYVNTEEYGYNWEKA